MVTKPMSNPSLPSWLQGPSGFMSLHPFVVTQSSSYVALVRFLAVFATYESRLLPNSFSNGLMLVGTIVAPFYAHILVFVSCESAYPLLRYSSFTTPRAHFDPLARRTRAFLGQDELRSFHAWWECCSHR
ncbi:hypothetical protein C8Q78DRAFT_667741 [Trametes maxima]|nr:hypothetical protein C8Q78DRAFT_667741 [Trametes maxima]